MQNSLPLHSLPTISCCNGIPWLMEFNHVRIRVSQNDVKSSLEENQTSTQAKCTSVKIGI